MAENEDPDPTRTRSANDDETPLAPVAGERLPAPLQIRDPERYQRQGEQGRGGLGRVLRARDKELGRDVAVKELLTRSSSNELRFFREALITARLEHPGIVPIHEAGRWPDGTPFYAMKLVSGRPLKELIAEREHVAERMALLPNVVAIADAIAYAHDRRIIHRDLKPSNVMVGDFGETVVIDWGLAKVLDETDDPALAISGGSPSSDDGVTVAGSIVGTPAYMAPEQARGEVVDCRADVFAIGMILFDLCTGGPAKRNREAPLPATIDPDLLAIIAKATDTEPARRYPDGRALAQDLHAFLAGRRVRSRTYNLAELLAHWIRHNKRAVIAAIAVVALAFAAVGWSLRTAQLDRRRARDAVAGEAQARGTAEAERDRVTIAEAIAVHEVDPTAAFALVAARTRSPETALVMAQALGAGVAIYASPALPHRLTAVTATADLATITFATEARTTSVLDTATGAIVERAPGVSDPSLAPFRGEANVSATSGTWSARGDHEGRVSVRDTSDGNEWSFRAHTGAIRWLAIDPSTGRVATASDDAIRIWSVPKPAAHKRGDAPCMPNALVPHPTRSSMIAGACVGGGVFLGELDGAGGVILQAAAAHATVPVWHAGSLCWGTLDRSLVCAAREPSGLPRVVPYAGLVRALASDGQRLYVAVENGEILRHVDDGPAVPLARLDGEPSALRVSRPGELVATSRTGNVTFIDLGDGRVESAKAHDDATSGLAIGANGDVLIASWDGSVSRWSNRTFRSRHTGTGAVRDLQAAGDGFAATAGARGFRIEANGLSVTLDLRRPIRALAATRRYACAATEAGDVTIVDLERRRIASVPLGGAVAALAALDEAHLIASTAAGAFLVIDADAASFVELEGHGAPR